MTDKKNILLISVTESGREYLSSLFNENENYQIVDIIGKNSKNLTEDEVKKNCQSLCRDLTQILIVVDGRIKKSEVKIYYAVIEKFYNFKVERKIVKKIPLKILYQIADEIVKLTTFVRINFSDPDEDCEEDAKIKNWEKDVNDLKKEEIGKNISALINSLSKNGNRFVYFCGLPPNSAQEHEKTVYEGIEKDEKKKLSEYLKRIEAEKNGSQSSIPKPKEEEVLKAVIEIKKELSNIIGSRN